MEHLRVHEIINKAVKLLEHSIDRRIVIERKLEANPDGVMGDAALLQNAVLNLAVNARDAMPDGGVLTFKTTHVTLEPQFCHVQNPAIEPGKYLELSVSDTGVGMDENVQRQVFEPFFTTKAVGKGTGLGLSAVYGIIKEHKGTVALNSKPNRGSCFTLYLPLASAEFRVKSEPKFIADTYGDKSILLVDDEVALRKVAGRILQDLGYRVTTATNGKEAIETYAKQAGQIDLVLLDMVMPVMNGEETIRKLRELDPHVRILVTSGYSLNTGIGDLPQDIVCGFVQKPYRKEQLADAVARALKPVSEDA
jgi:CheY-like chemotaxis protein